MGKYIRLQNCAFSDIFGSDLTPRVVALCMGTAFAIGENLGKFGGPQLPYQKSQKISGPRRTYDYHMETSESFCDVTPAGLYIIGPRLVTGRYVLGVLYRENRSKSENWATLTSRSSSTVRHTEKLIKPRKLPGPCNGLQRGVTVSLRSASRGL